MIRSLLFIALLFGTLSMRAQSYDTLSVMAYNLLFYGANFGNCDNNTNGLNDKDGYLKTITDHVEPDILLVNELGASGIYSDRILISVLNTDGEDRYERAQVQNNGFSSIVNQLFYNSEKLGLAGQYAVSEDLNSNNLVRVIDVYRLYHKDTNLLPTDDTTFFTVVAAHLKAGSTNSDEADRALATEALMDDLSSGAAGYVIMGGDLNLKSSNEDAYEELLSDNYGDHRFYDPISSPGTWNNASVFAPVHTQSTRLSNTNGGCFSGGGMDDRFDFLLMSGQVINDTGKVSYVQDSYTALGQDGLHFNQEINDGSNNSVPASVLSALYNMSDHLPVVADIRIPLAEPVIDGVADRSLPEARIFQVPDHLQITNLDRGGQVRLFNLQGTLLQEQNIAGRTVSVPMSEYPSGVYILSVEQPQQRQSFKVVHLR